jgi:hypothetical protein
MTNTKSGPIEVWLRQANLEVVCNVVYEDETSAQYEVSSMSMRGAQREMTSFFIAEGYKPVGRWEVEASDANGALETVRRFKPE